ncbi:MAG: fibronectin type III domain-containing protein [Planctomycetes bacterium]|nr:fibronectin type III domain-containing protein [Planctomycetota bacterium]MCH9723762.1 fibronectin type III domain-containing protein [Planctomycetota bacterium]MCH9776074.1 fibronectin type III domain-containing protein [Planctomycetota bacterium]MCH9789815.1 fibronectin type III domain-containing protein [Planctomycetota bacterium]
MRFMLALFLISLLFERDVTAGDPIRLPVTKDNSIVMVKGEWELNAGQQGRIRIKGNQHMVAMAFDTSAIKGKRIKSATLVCVQGKESISGVTLSTIATPWDETRSNGLTAGISGIDNWGYKGARFPAVCGGNGFTLVHQANSKIRDGKYHWNVPPDMIHAMVIGVAHGLALHEHSADTRRNPTIFAHEQSGKKPYLLVELDDQVPTTPKAPTGMRLTATNSRSAQLTLTSPAQNGFAYEVTVDGKLLGRHNIPLIKNGQKQTIPLRDLPSSIAENQTYAIKVVTLNRTGQRSQPAVIRSVILKSDSVDKPVVAFAPAHSSPVTGLSVIPVTDKFDSSGKAVGKLPADYRTHNAIFNGRRVQLTAAAGEVVGFQLLLRGKDGKKVSVKVQLDEPETRIDLHQAVYVPEKGRLIPDPLLPMPDFLSLKPDSDHSIVADIYIPFDASPGFRRGKITISDGRIVPLLVKVLPFALPRQATFFCEMNSYGLPDHVNHYYALQHIAYDHRVHANILHYSHHTAAPGARKSNFDMRLRSGRRMDNKRYDGIQPGSKVGYWDDFVNAFGPYIDGSLFKDGHRGPISPPGFYLTFHESWPLNCRAYFNGNPDAYQAFADQPLYARTYVNILQDFARLAKSKGWKQTGFQVYFNNKGSLNEKTKAPWILDEPSGYWDYRALQFYGELTDRGRNVAPGVQINYRIDISRPEYCRGQLDRLDDLWVVSSSAFQNYRRLVTDRMHRDDLTAWVYGTSNHVNETNRNIQAWALDAWQDGATGIVPWQTVNKSGSALTKADQLGLFIFDKNASGETVIRHSMRLKAYRDAQQLIEYLNLLQQQRGWSQDQMRRFVNQYVNLNAQVNKTDEADAGTTAYGRLSASGLETLRMAASKLLAAQ